MVQQRTKIFLLLTCLMILFVSGTVLSSSEKVNTKELQKDFAKVFEKNERDMRENPIHLMEKTERFINSPTNHFIIKTKSDSTEVDELIKEICLEYSLIQIRKLPGSDHTVHILRKAIQLDNERSTRATLDTDIMSNIVKSHSSQILEFYNEKKYNFSKR